MLFLKSNAPANNALDRHQCLWCERTNKEGCSFNGLLEQHAGAKTIRNVNFKVTRLTFFIIKQPNSTWMDGFNGVYLNQSSATHSYKMNLQVWYSMKGTPHYFLMPSQNRKSTNLMFCATILIYTINVLSKHRLGFCVISHVQRANPMKNGKMVELIIKE